MIVLHPPSHVHNKKIHLSGSKSLSNRLLVLKEVLGLNVALSNLSLSEDTFLLSAALDQIREPGSYIIDIKDAGTNMRFLTALLATKKGVWELGGSDRMKERPIGELVKALQLLGADIKYLEKENYPPLRISGKQLNGGVIEMDAGISSQFISAILLIAPLLSGDLEIKLKGKPVSQPYTNMTIKLLGHFGVKVLEETSSITIKQTNTNQALASVFEVESDWSSASYWYSICALSKGSIFELDTMHKASWQGDSVLPELFDQLGVRSTFDKGKLILENKKVESTSFEFDFTDCPDLAQTFACCCFALNIPARLHGLKTLQLKESRRIDVLSAELKKCGALVENTDHSLFIKPRKAPAPVEQISISTHKDHRMAMAFTALSFIFPGLIIEDPEVVNKSYPAFWDDLHSVGFSLILQP